MEAIRSFIAIEIPRELQLKLGDLQRELKQAEADIKWVDPEGIHLTLKFLGSVNQEVLEKIVHVLPPLTSEVEPFSLRIQGLGCFPSNRNPRVLWVGLQQGVEEVSRLQKEIEKRIEEMMSSSDERTFQPHLTIGRVRSPRRMGPLSRIIELQQGVEIGTFTASEVHLIKSDLRPSGAIYSKLHSFDLGKS